MNFCPFLLAPKVIASSLFQENRASMSCGARAVRHLFELHQSARTSNKNDNI